MPIVGTTYMASDVHRKFLFEPNPHVWDLDFREMKTRGINFVRTGLWTAWSRAMLDPGAAGRGRARARSTPTSQTAAGTRIHVCFTFFAFQPPYYGGSNPYLDPRALEGQRALLTLVASRFRGVPWVHWDLINEPSYSPPRHALEQPADAATRTSAAPGPTWLKKRHGDDPARCARRWRDAAGRPLALPAVDDLALVDDPRGPPRRGRAHDFARLLAGRGGGLGRATCARS